MMIRNPAVAGMFYPGNPHKLRKDVEGLLSKAKKLKKNIPSVRALVTPHAGYMYSGFTAAVAYSLLFDKSYDSVIIVGPSHRQYFSGDAIHPGDAFRTPLGDVPINRELREELADEGKMIYVADKGHIDEHSIEVQLPFLQIVFKEFSFVPIAMGDQKKESIYTLAEKLSTVLKNKNVLLIASTDLSHYYPYNTAITIDKRLIELVERFECTGLIENLEKQNVEACGGGPLAAVMLAAESLGGKNATILHYCNSGDVTGDHSGVVGYLAASVN